MTRLLLKSAAVWFLFVPAAILNGLLRQEVLVAVAGPVIALPLSGILLSALIFLITFLAWPWLHRSQKNVYWIIGGFWLLLALSFEFLFGHFVMNDSWAKLFAAFDFTTGNLWLLVLLITFFAPWLSARLRKS
jgi:hypothetical protein